MLQEALRVGEKIACDLDVLYIIKSDSFNHLLPDSLIVGV